MEVVQPRRSPPHDDVPERQTVASKLALQHEIDRCLLRRDAMSIRPRRVSKRALTQDHPPPICIRGSKAAYPATLAESSDVAVQKTRSPPS